MANETALTVIGNLTADPELRGDLAPSGERKERDRHGRLDTKPWSIQFLSRRLHLKARQANRGDYLLYFSGRRVTDDYPEQPGPKEAYSRPMKLR